MIARAELFDRDNEPRAASEALPGIDLEQLASFLDQPTASAAIRAYRAALRAS